MEWTKPLVPQYDYLAPDGSEICLLLEVTGGGMPRWPGTEEEN